MIPWLVVAGLLSGTADDLSHVVSLQKSFFPSSGEINFQVRDVGQVLSALEKVFVDQCIEIDREDGLSFLCRLAFAFRGSNTEPLLRLNVETRGDEELLLQR